jgi:hypothetical protein
VGCRELANNEVLVLGVWVGCGELVGARVRGRRRTGGVGRIEEGEAARRLCRRPRVAAAGSLAGGGGGGIERKSDPSGEEEGVVRLGRIRKGAWAAAHHAMCACGASSSRCNRRCRGAPLSFSLFLF